VAAKEKLKAAEARHTVRSEVSLRTKRSPSCIRRQTRGGRSDRSGIDSRSRIRRIDRHDSAKNSALDAAAIGADSSDTNAPAREGPPIPAADRLPSSALLPRTS
jgi:hypothetical protein